MKCLLPCIVKATMITISFLFFYPLLYSQTNGNQNFRITGKVTDANNQAIQGVNLVEKGTTNGAATDANGIFSLSIRDRSGTVIVTAVGYEAREIDVNGVSDLAIKLTSEAQALERIVVVGYGTQKKKELTSAITSVSEREFNKGPIASSPLQLIQGKVPGLGIARANGGDPTSEIQMQMRGVSTVKGNLSPLIVIDGVPGGNLNTVAPEDIESIDILRDGSAAAVYGTRGTNGVVIITTKKGRIGLPSVQYSGYVYYEKYNNKLEVLNADDWRQIKGDFANSDNEILKNKVGSIIDYGGNTDWFDAVGQNKLSQVHNLSISGANQKTNYYASINYRDVQGLIKRSFNRILNYRLSISHSVLNDRLVFDFNMGSTFGKSRPSNYGMFTSALLRNPTFPVYNPDGTFHQEADLSGGNLVAQIYQYENDIQRNENLVITRATLKLTDALKVSVMGGMQRNNEIAGTYYYRNAYASVIGGYRDLNGEAARTTQQAIDQTLETTMTYDKLIAGSHRLNVVGGYSYQDFQTEGFGANNRNFISDANTYNNLNAGLALSDGLYRNNDIWSSKRSSKLIAFFSRAIYSFDDKYMLTAGIRREGSSKFGKNNKWGFFPAVSAGWRISQEGFMRNSNVINDLKLRVGYGVTGNQGIQEYVSLERLSTGGMMLYNGRWIAGYVPSSNPNPDLRWEKKSETNIGIDLAMYNNRLIFNQIGRAHV